MIKRHNFLKLSGAMTAIFSNGWQPKAARLAKLGRKKYRFRFPNCGIENNLTYAQQRNANMNKGISIVLTALLLPRLATLHAADAPKSSVKPSNSSAMENPECEPLKKSLGMIQILPLGFGKMERNTETPRQGEKWELIFSLEASFRNPFDPEEVRVDLELSTPSGKTLIVPGFFYTPCALAPDGVVRPAGAPAWKVRYTPYESGVYHYRLRAKDRTGTIEGPQDKFRCLEAKVRGPLRISRQVPAAFEFANGTPYHPVGWNLHPWATPDREAVERLPAMLSNLERLAACGGNYIRLRADSFYVPIEAIANATTGFLGLGFYHPGASWEIDQVYEKAEHLGIMLMHCFLEGNSFAHKVAKPELRNRYNAMLSVNGGPCVSPFDFWSNPEAARFMKQQLRYAIARWGYSPNLMAWELANEVEDHDSGGHEFSEVTRWHQDQARFLKSTDPVGHLVTTSDHIKSGVEGHALWHLAEIDFCQTHLYEYADPAVDYPRLARKFHAAYAKPVFFGEYGITSKTGDMTDPFGIHVHNALFSTALDGLGAGVANWYVEELLKQGHERHLTTFTQFTSDLPWNDPGLETLRVSNVVGHPPAGASVYRDVSITPGSTEPFKKMEQEHFAVNPATREVSHAEFLQKYLHAMKGRKSRPTFLLDCAKPAEFVVSVSRSVGDVHNALIISLDRTPVLTRPFPADKDHGTNQVFSPESRNWTCDYHVEVKLPVPAGHHEVRVEAVGKDRLEVGYRILHYSPASDPVAVVGRGTKDHAWIWVRNQVNTDENERQGIKPVRMGGASATIEGLGDGRYQIQFHDPWSKRAFPPSEALCSQGRLKLSTPSFTRSLLCTARRLP